MFNNFFSIGSAMSTPLYLQIFQSKVDSFQPGKTPRCRKLTATLPRDCKKIIPKCFHLVTLNGAIAPSQMLIMLDAFNPIESQGQSIATPHPIEEQRPLNYLRVCDA